VALFGTCIKVQPAGTQTEVKFCSGRQKGSLKASWMSPVVTLNCLDMASQNVEPFELGLATVRLLSCAIPSVCPQLTPGPLLVLFPPVLFPLIELLLFEETLRLEDIGKPS
jgi:hypothetical protein